MEPKKNPKADLEKKKGLFMQTGLVVSLLVIWLALEWKTYDKSNFNLGELMLEDIEEEIIPITEQQIQQPPPPPPIEQLVIVEDEEELEEELEVKDIEVSETTEISVAREEEVVVEEEIFTIVEEMPEFPGGEGALLSYLVTNTKYPPMAKESGISGTVFVNFTINSKGEVKDVKILRGIGGGCDEEAVRVVKTLPKWAPGKQRGKPVSVSYNLPYRFVLR